MSSELRSQIEKDVKSAMRAKEKERLQVLRMLLAAIKQKEVDERITLDDNGITSILTKMIKQRRESIKQYTAGNRPELADQEQAEIVILEVYLPQALSEEEVETLIKQAITESNANSIKDMGKVMGWLKPKLSGRADMGQVSAKIKALLS